MLCPLSLPDIKERSPRLRLPAVTLHALHILWVHIRDSGWSSLGNKTKYLYSTFFAAGTARLLGGVNLCYRLQVAAR